MNFIHSILGNNYRKIFYELINDQDEDDVDLTKPIRVVKFDRKPSTYYHIAETPNCSEAVSFGLPHNRKWFLYRSRKDQSTFYYKKAEIASVLRVLLFDMCGLYVKNIEEFINDFENKNPPYSNESFKNFYKRLVKLPWFDEVSLHRLTVDVDGKYYKLKNINNEFNNDVNTFVRPKVEVECERSFHSFLNDHLTLYLFCRYLQQLLGPGVPRIIQIPIQEVFRDIKLSFDFYKYVHKNRSYLFLDVCPTVHDFLVFQDFFKHCNNINSNNHRN
ncbi:uncharacterized protein [Chelonus insularis]|uniref:uncharacterized protein n=1 Tax=Chelonus insularis TaxID=460826 RepID=UPI00158DBA8D|nr:uncharacterized protein LOC118063763 [Chelonus insularis]KAG8148366.1 HzNVorf93-like protein [Chelonus insularis]